MSKRRTPKSCGIAAARVEMDNAKRKGVMPISLTRKTDCSHREVCKFEAEMCLLECRHYKKALVVYETWDEFKLLCTCKIFNETKSLCGVRPIKTRVLCEKETCPRLIKTYKYWGAGKETKIGNAPVET